MVSDSVTYLANAVSPLLLFPSSVLEQFLLSRYRIEHSTNIHSPTNIHISTPTYYFFDGGWVSFSWRVQQIPNEHIKQTISLTKMINFDANEYENG